MLVAALVRLVALDLKPIHSDESVNGTFLLRFLLRGVYRYDPTDFHGPWLYYVTAPFLAVFGASDAVLRLPTALGGTAAVASLWLYRRWLGAWGVVAAAGLFAVSPVDVFFARTAIHETWLVLGTLLGLAGALHGWRGARWGWWLAGVGAGIAVTSKETVVITAGGLVLGGLAAAGSSVSSGVVRESWAAHRRGILTGLAVMLVLTALLFTSLGTHPRGLVDAVGALGPWAEYGLTGRNQPKPFGYHTAHLGWWTPVWAVALVGLADARSRTVRALVAWFAGVWLVYEALPYKTPWCTLQIAVPLVLLAGFAVGRGRLRRLAVGLALLGGLEGARATVEVNAVRYDDPDLPFVYVQHTRAYRDHVDALLAAPEPVRVAGIRAARPLVWHLRAAGWPYGHTPRRNVRPTTPAGLAAFDQELAEADVVLAEGDHAAWVAGRLPAHLGHRVDWPGRRGKPITMWSTDAVAAWWRPPPPEPRRPAVPTSLLPWMR